MIHRLIAGITLSVTLSAVAAAQATAARAQTAATNRAVHEWLAFTPHGIETADSVESMIVRPNGRHMVLPADSGQVYLTVRGTLKRILADSGLVPVKLDYVYLLDAKGQTYESTVTGLSFYPAIDESPEAYSFMVPRGTIAARLRFGKGEADLRKLKVQHVPTTLRN